MLEQKWPQCFSTGSSLDVHAAPPKTSVERLEAPSRIHPEAPNPDPFGHNAAARVVSPSRAKVSHVASPQVSLTSAPDVAVVHSVWAWQRPEPRRQPELGCGMKNH